MAHTPGPWEYHQQSGVVVKNGLGGVVIARITNPVRVEGAEIKGFANGHLIAAAPELLEALKGALETAIFESHPNRPWHQAAAEAIHKATGGE